MSERIFLDLGTHRGQGLKQFIEMYDMNRYWHIHSFEANPFTYESFMNNEAVEFVNFNVNFYNWAVSDKEGTTTIYHETYGNEIDTGQGSSIIPIEKWNTNQEFNQKSEVRTIDFAKFVEVWSTMPKDKIVVKMDIEGSEYHVLEHLIDTGMIHRIRDLHVEWHSRCFNKDTEEYENILKREKYLKEYLFNLPNLAYGEWH